MAFQLELAPVAKVAIISETRNQIMNRTFPIFLPRFVGATLVVALALPATGINRAPSPKSHAMSRQLTTSWSGSNRRGRPQGAPLRNSHSRLDHSTPHHLGGELLDHEEAPSGGTGFQVEPAAPGQIFLKERRNHERRGDHRVNDCRNSGQHGRDALTDEQKPGLLQEAGQRTTEPVRRSAPDLRGSAPHRGNTDGSYRGRTVSTGKPPAGRSTDSSGVPGICTGLPAETSFVLEIPGTTRTTVTDPGPTAESQ